jgi:hypothetical protein
MIESVNGDIERRAGDREHGEEWMCVAAMMAARENT